MTTMFPPEPRLTQQQLQIWASQKLYPDLPLYNLVVTFTIDGNVSLTSFRHAFQFLLNHTDALRSVVKEIGDLAHWHVLNDLTYTVPFLNFTGETDPQSYFKAWLQKQKQISFNLNDHLFDTALIQTAGNRFIWYLKLHHLVADGWSISAIYHRLQWFYDQISQGHPVDTPNYPQFEAHQAEEAQYLASEQYQDDHHYWQIKQTIEPAPLKLYGRPIVYGPGPSRRIVCPLGPERTAAFKALAGQPEFAAKTINVALFNIFTGLLAAFLYQISGNTQLAVGTVFANRTTKVSRQSVGLFMKMVPLLLELDPADTLTSLIGKVQVESAATLKHFRYPVRNSTENPYNVVFNFHNRPRYPALAGMPVHVDWVHTGYDDVALSVQLQNPDVAGDSFELYLDFKENIFDNTEQQLLVSHFLNTLDNFLAQPDQLLAELSVQTAEEWHQTLVAWNQTRHDFPQQCVQQLFEAQAVQNPDAVACIAAGQGDQAADQITFRELNQQANQLAHYLQRFGIGPESVVAIHMDRSLETVVAVLAVLKAGAAYLPLDTAYPAERLGYILADSQVSIVLTNHANLASLPDLQIQQVICLEDEAEKIAYESQANPTGQVTLGNLAYVLYTSGSTGRPKGVLGTHRGIANRLAWMYREYPFTPGEVTAHKTSLNFIDSIWELFGPLLQGLPVLIIPQQMVKELMTLAATLARYQVSRLWLVPSLLQTLLEVMPDLAQRLPHLTFLVTTGEAILPALYLRTQAQIPQATLYNLYGTSEVWDATWYEPKDDDDLTTVPIGRPLDNVETYILNEQLRPVPVGVPGHLYIGGAGLARGYLNRPELTAEKFIPHLFTSVPGDRLYATGDLARYRPDGNIEYLGRFDHQVKLRGHRIELEEIETVLSQHPVVSQSAARLYPQTIAQTEVQQLVAFVVLQGNQPPGQSDLRTFLRSRLPEYMIPGDFIVLPALPLTPSGKINRQALPAPIKGTHRADGRSNHTETPLERQLLRIWEKTFQVRPLSVHDDFFNLGGHSLLAVQLFSEIERMTGFKLPPSTLFQAPTVARLAQLLRHERILLSDRSLVPLQPDGSGPPLFCIHALFGGIFFFYDLVHHLGTNQPVYGLQTYGYERGQPAHNRIEDMAAHYIQAIKSVQAEGPYFLCGFSLGGFIAFEMAQQLQGQGHQVALVALLDTCASCLPNYFRAPLSRPMLFKYRIWSIRQALRFHRGKFSFLSSNRWLTTVRAINPLASKEYSPAWADHSTTLLHKIGAIDKPLEETPVPDHREEVVAANLTAVKHYIPQSYSGKVTLFRATDNLVPTFDPKTYGWAALAGSCIEVLEVPGTHLTLLKEPNVQHLAAKLSDCLSRS